MENKKITIAIQICGGLGNQLFQYLFAISNFSESHYQIIFDCSDLMGEDVRRPFVLNQIGLSGNFMDCVRIQKYFGGNDHIILKNINWLDPKSNNIDLHNNQFQLVQEASSEYQEILPPSCNTYYRGYWQSTKYWKNPMDLLQSAWGVIAGSEKYQQAMKHKEILQIDPSCCAVHVRGGDYLEFMDFHGVCRSQYYAKAISLIAGSNYHVYSDDSQFALNILGKNHNVVFASDQIGDDLLEFICLTEYSKFIIPNSSFSYLAACFATAIKQKAKVIAPYPWYSIDMQGPSFQESWVALNRASGNSPQEDALRVQKASVSVILPVHARALHLESVIDSVMHQTHMPIEIIISQNNATQDVKNEVARLAKDNELIKVIDTSYPDSLSFARNVAIKNSIGDYVAFIDDDDYWMPEKLRLQISSSIKMGAGLVASNFHEFNEEEGIFSRSSYKSWRGESWVNILHQGNPFAGGSAALVRRDVFDRVGLFDEGMPSCEDHDMWWRIASSGETLYFLEEDLVGIRKNSHNISNNEEFMIRGHLIHLSKMMGDKRIPREQIVKYFDFVSNSLSNRLKKRIIVSLEKNEEGITVDEHRAPYKSFKFYFTRVAKSQILHYPTLKFIRKTVIHFKEECRLELWGDYHSSEVSLNGIHKTYFTFYVGLRMFIAFVMLPLDVAVYFAKKMKRLFSRYNIL